MAQRKAEKLLAAITDYSPVTDPLGALQLLAGRAVRWMQVLEGIVADLQRIRYTTQAEQVDGRIVVYERAMDRCGKLLVDIARLDIEERLVKLSEAQARILNDVIMGAFTDVGLSAELREAARPAIAARLRLAVAGERQPVQLAIAAPGEPA